MGLPGQNAEPYCWSAMKLMKVSYSEELLSSGSGKFDPLSTPPARASAVGA